MQVGEPGDAGPAGELQGLLDELAAALGHSLTLDTPDGALLGYSAQADNVDPVRIAAILTRRVPDEVLAYQRSHGITTATGPVRIPANSALKMTARTCLPIWRDRRLSALLWVLDDEANTLDAESLVALEAAGKRIARLLPATGASAGERQLASLLEGQPQPDLMSHLARLEGRVRPNALQFVCTIAATVIAGERGPVRTTDRPNLIDTTPALAGAHLHGQTLTLTAASSAPFQHRQPRASTDGSAACFVHGTSAGFRTERLGPDGAAQLAARAIVSAGCAAVDAALPLRVAWEDLGLYRSLLLHTRPDGWSDAAPFDHDDHAASLLRHTVETYLDYGGDAARTIAALHIHRTTFYYRLERLNSRYGVRLDDGLVRSELHVALKIRRLARARDQFEWSPALIAHLARVPSG